MCSVARLGRRWRKWDIAIDISCSGIAGVYRSTVEYLGDWSCSTEGRGYYVLSSLGRVMAFAGSDSA